MQRADMTFSLIVSNQRPASQNQGRTIPTEKRFLNPDETDSSEFSPEEGEGSSKSHIALMSEKGFRP